MQRNKCHLVVAELPPHQFPLRSEIDPFVPLRSLGISGRCLQRFIHDCCLSKRIRGSTHARRTSEIRVPITVNVLSIDTTTTVSFTLDDGTTSDTVGPQNFTGAGAFQVPLSAFIGVDETSVDSLTMVLTGQSAWDATFDLVATTSRIPLPAPLALMGLGLLGLGLVRRKA